MSLHHFLLVFNLRERHLVEVKNFYEDADRATECYSERELEYRNRPDAQDFEIVLIGADSIETIKRTHSHYFDFGDHPGNGGPFMIGVSRLDGGDHLA